MSDKIKLYTSVINPISNDLFFADDTELISYFNETECEVKTENCELLAIEDYETEQIKTLQHENKVLKYAFYNLALMCEKNDCNSCPCYSNDNFDCNKECDGNNCIQRIILFFKEEAEKEVEE